MRDAQIPQVIVVAIIYCVELSDESFISQDVQFADIDYMDHEADFTIGENFTSLPEFVRTEKKNGLRFIPILDPAINTEKTNIVYAPHLNAMEADAYITWYNSTLQPSKDCTSSPGNCQPLDDVMLGYVSFHFGRKYCRTISAH